MRRFAVPLFLVAVASLAPAPAAHAEEFCARVWTENRIGPNVDTQPVSPCVTGYPYGVYCHYDDTAVPPYVALHVWFCHPL